MICYGDGQASKGEGWSFKKKELEATDADTEIAIVQPAVAPLQVPQRSRLLRAERIGVPVGG